MNRLDDHDKLSLTWDLNKIFSGGSDSYQLKEMMSELEQELKDLANKSSELIVDTKSVSNLVQSCQDTRDKLREVGAFIRCLVSQDQTDKEAQRLEAYLGQLEAKLEAVMIDLESIVQEFWEEDWQKLINSQEINPIKFFMEELRAKGKNKMAPDKEKLAADLAVDGYHGWGQLYHTIIGDIEIQYQDQIISVGQAHNLLSDPNQNVRFEIGQKIEEAFQNKEHLIANTLNHLAGYRLNLYKHRHWDDFLYEAMTINRVSQKTIETMWDTISKYKETFTDYYENKKQFLNLEKFGWFDRNAPLSSDDSQIEFGEGAQFIIDQFEKVSQEMADFAEMALINRWVEAENRANKRPGGFCATFPMSGESRIFMTYSGTSRNVATLAHELGHAYHQWTLKELPSFSAKYPMTLAETASTFAEQVVSDAAIEASQSKEEMITLLDDKISRSCAFFMDLHSRFLFETSFYREREAGPVDVDRLNQLMVEAQRKAYLNSLDHWHPRFWATKLHFYLTKVPFYNFPYTFGYLFSMGIYALYKNSPEDFPEIYKKLLKDTGSMTVEELAWKHMGTDLTKPDFWEEAVANCIADVDKLNSILKD
ncbi:M3 family oligoendopeptidase [Natranaerobius thermophilus]|uniref:Oligopeptidase F n=1 Tax=Natranaerobius thermophilus (strain ATCC BAA-1301 / DSM 18059 / JW/NM-WN-LF) TaxID=457570 RepID=B2A3V0_NATTJ|nr:M3 family oligoendopeptidase [Natranaerobius thermophilus]ACB83729.1 Oligopeptidase F [Natranaerobius thermophilus JW/NM-WN-LF]